MRALFGLFLAGALSAMEQPPSNWSVTDTRGQCFNASNCLGQVTLLVFADTPCAPVDAFLHQTLKPLAKDYSVQVLLVFPSKPESTVRGFAVKHGPFPSNIACVSLPPVDLLAAMYFEPGTNIWPTTWMLDRSGRACFKWRSFVQKNAMESIMCAELEDLQIKRGAPGEAVVSWRALPITPTILYTPSLANGWGYSLSFPFGHPTNSSGRCEYRGEVGFYRLKWR